MQALTKKALNQMKKTTWPILALAYPPGSGGGAAYLMSSTLADRWNQVRSEPKVLPRKSYVV